MTESYNGNSSPTYSGRNILAKCKMTADDLDALVRLHGLENASDN